MSGDQIIRAKKGERKVMLVLKQHQLINKDIGIKSNTC